MAYHLSTKAATPPGSSNIPSWSNNKESSSEDVNLFRILNEVSKMSLVPQKQQQECERPPSASASASASASSSLPLSLSSLLSIAKQSYSCSTPDRFSIASNSNVKRTLHVPRCLFTTPLPLVVTNKIKQQRESSLPPTTSTSTSTTVPIGIFLGRRKRQRCCGEGPPPMLPSSPEFDNTADTNPFGRHVAIHSPIAGVGNTMNLEFIAKIKLEPPPPPPPPPINNCNVAARQRQQQHTRSLSSSFTTSSSASTSSSSTNISSPSLSEEKMMMIDRIQNIFPILDGDTEDGDGGNIEQERGEKNEMIIGIKTRALKMRRKCHNNNHCNIFEPTAFTI